MTLSELKEKHSDLDISFMYASDCLVLDRLVVPKDRRKEGLGSSFMKDLVSIAQDNKWIIMLSPSDSLGATSVSRLRKFYGRFGFERNFGKKKRFELPNYGMYKMPNN